MLAIVEGAELALPSGLLGAIGAFLVLVLGAIGTAVRWLVLRHGEQQDAQGKVVLALQERFAQTLQSQEEQHTKELDKVFLNYLEIARMERSRHERHERDEA